MKGVTFGTRHSFDDFGLILTSKSLGLPKAKTSTVEVAGADGVIDTSEVLTGEIKFENRVLSFEFVMNDKYEDINDKITEIANYLHGRKMKIILDEDNQHYYYGRCTVNEWLTDRRVGEIAITCDCEPYKYDLYETVINTTVNGETVMNVHGKRRTICPTIQVIGNVSVEIDGESITLYEGNNEILDFYIKEGDNVLIFNGDGMVTLTYRGGEL